LEAVAQSRGPKAVEVPEPSEGIALSRLEGSPRVLVADDNSVNQRLATAMLHQLGYAVDVASDGAQAVAMWRDCHYHAILMDYQMPGLDGIEATRIIRQEEPAGHRTPVIALTASVLPDAQERCYQGGMDGYLTKPMSLDMLRDVLNRFVKTSPDLIGAHTPALK
jgi:CheY-like chemotaxis protein